MVTSSPWTKKRGAASRTITFLRTMVLSVALPTLVSGVMPRAVARQVVSESGNSTLVRAWPAPSVTRSAAQYAVSGNALRTLGSVIARASTAPGATAGRISASCMRRLPGFAAEEIIQRVFGGYPVPSWPKKNSEMSWVVSRRMA